MQNKGQMISRLPIFLAVVFLIAAGVSFYLYWQASSENKILRVQLDEANEKYRAAQAKLLEAQNTVDSLQEKLKQVEDKTRQLEEALEKERRTKSEALSNLEELERTRRELEDRLERAQTEAAKLQEKVDLLTQEKKEIESKVQETNKQQGEEAQNVALGKIVVSPNTSSDAARLEGKVLIVNKEYDFSVISIGSKDGVKLDDIFSVYRNDEYLGDVKIEKLHDTMAAGGFLTPQLKEKIREGDRVVRKD